MFNTIQRIECAYGILRVQVQYVGRFQEIEGFVRSGKRKGQYVCGTLAPQKPQREVRGRRKASMPKEAATVVPPDYFHRKGLGGVRGVPGTRT